MRKGQHLQIYLAAAVILAQLHPFLAHRAVLLDCLLHQRAQFQHQIRACHFQQIEAGATGRRLDVRAGLTAELEYLHVPIDDHARRPVFIQNQLLGLLLHCGCG